MTNSDSHNTLTQSDNVNANEPQASVSNVQNPKKIFVGNLPFDTSVEELIEHFGKFGKIVDKQLPVIRQVLKGFAYVEYDDSQSAEKAIESLNNTEFQGRKLKVDKMLENTGKTKLFRKKKTFFNSNKFKNNNKRNNQNRITNNSDDKEDNNSQDLPIPRIHSENDSHSDQNNEENADSLEFEDLENTRNDDNNYQTNNNRRRGFNSRSRGGRSFRGGFRGRGRSGYQRRYDKNNINNGEPSSTTLYVSNLTENTTEDDLKLLFKEFSVKNIELITFQNGKCKGYGFVELEDNEEQKKALDADSGTMCIGTTQVHLKPAFGQKRERKQSNNNENNQENDNKEH